MHSLNYSTINLIHSSSCGRNTSFNVVDVYSKSQGKKYVLPKRYLKNLLSLRVRTLVSEIWVYQWTIPSPLIQG